MSTELLTVNTIVFFFMALIWLRSSWFNMFLKVIFFALGIWNGFALLQNLGYIIKTS